MSAFHTLSSFNVQLDAGAQQRPLNNLLPGSSGRSSGWTCSIAIDYNSLSLIIILIQECPRRPARDITFFFAFSRTYAKDSKWLATLWKISHREDSEEISKKEQEMSEDAANDSRTARLCPALFASPLARRFNSSTRALATTSPFTHKATSLSVSRRAPAQVATPTDPPQAPNPPTSPSSLRTSPSSQAAASSADHRAPSHPARIPRALASGVPASQLLDAHVAGEGSTRAPRLLCQHQRGPNALQPLARARGFRYPRESRVRAPRWWPHTFTYTPHPARAKTPRAARRPRRAGLTGPVRRVAVPFRRGFQIFFNGTATGRI
ncbi:hypothetical protein FB451DRAFT_1169882 [Mycena latifolia]|nr:hypothetical protein FB451DRAFT_1169882 [Mycena latifolia]